MEEDEFDGGHPLEEVFDMESGSTEVKQYETPQPPAIINDEDMEPHKYDNRDNKIENKLDIVYEFAVSAFQEQQQEAEMVEPRYAARSREIAAQFLNTALGAVKEQRLQKEGKDKINIQHKNTGPEMVNNNLIVGDRNDILKALMNQKPEDE